MTVLRDTDHHRAEMILFAVYGVENIKMCKLDLFGWAIYSLTVNPKNVTIRQDRSKVGSGATSAYL